MKHDQFSRRRTEQMALAAVRTRKPADPPVTLAVVPAPPTLAERLAEAQRQAAGPAARVAELEEAMRNALACEDFAAAEKVKRELAEARQEHGITSAAVHHLQSAIVEAERRMAEDGRIIREAQAKAEAQRVIGDAIAAEQRALDLIDACVGKMEEHLEAARADFLEAQTWEQRAGAEHRRMWQARIQAGEAESMPRFLPTPNKASVLADTPLIRELAKWTGLERRTPPPVFVAGPGGTPGRAQQSPFR